MVPCDTSGVIPKQEPGVASEHYCVWQKTNNKNTHNNPEHNMFWFNVLIHNITEEVNICGQNQGAIGFQQAELMIKARSNPQAQSQKYPQELLGMVLKPNKKMK